MQHRPGRLLLLEYVSTAGGSGSSRCRTSLKAPPQTPTTGFRTGAGVRPPCPCRTLNLGALILGAPALAQAQALPPEHVSISYYRPTEWTPGGKGFDGAACAAGSDYRVLVPSKGCPPLPATAGGPHQGAHPRRADRPRRALRGSRAGWHVGTTPAFRLSAPSLEQGSVSGPRLSRAARGRGVGVRPDGQHWRVYFSFFLVLSLLFNLPGVPGCPAWPAKKGARRRPPCAGFLKKIKIKIRKKDAHR